MKLPKLLAFLLFGILLCLCGCASKTNLPAGTVYGSDAVLFNYEKITPGAFSAMNVFVTWEYNHRQVLSQWPAIKQAADNIRVHAKDWRASAIALHDAYVSNPTDANRTALQQTLDVINAALQSANTYMSAHSTSNLTPTSNG